MKKTLLIIVLLMSTISFTQISISSRPADKRYKKITEKIYNEFKSSTTIFTLSNIYDTKTYEKILKDSWKITPYKIVSKDKFNLDNYLNSNYSFIDLSVSLFGSPLNKLDDERPNISLLYFYVELKTYNSEKIKNKLKKLKGKKNNNKKDYEKIISKNTNSLTFFYLTPKNNFLNKTIGGNIDNIIEEIYSKDVFKNYNPGFLKNYFQKLNSILESQKTYKLNSKNRTKELAQLETKKLYIPSYSKLSLNYTPKNKEDMILYSEYPADLFKKYKYPFFIENVNTLSDKIMNGVDLYYLRYSRINAIRFIEIINSITGEIIYKERAPIGMRTRSKHFKAINNAIKRAVKNQ